MARSAIRPVTSPSPVREALTAGRTAPSPATALRPGPKAVIRLQHPEPPAPQDIFTYYELAREAGFYSNGGPCATLLAEHLGYYLGSDTTAIPVGNCTVGLMVALRGACGAPSGSRRRIITPSYTFTATACAIAWAGFEPVFVDVEPDGWHIDPTALDEALEQYGDTVAGVLACATFGTPPASVQRSAWRAACNRHGVPLLVDSAPGFGASDDQGRPLGGLGDTEIFSFHATKPFAVGEGGLIATADPELITRINRLVNFGLEPGSRASVEIGMNAKMSELHAAAGLAMLDRIDGVVRRRRENAQRLHQAIADLPYTLQAGSDRSTWQIFHVQAPTAEIRDRCLELAPLHAIEVRTMHSPVLHLQPAFAGAEHGPLPVTESLGERALALPMANQLPEDAYERIPALLRAACA
jgi:dTDP-4-amino-4,6-dideoxygalactose transaminase